MPQVTENPGRQRLQQSRNEFAERMASKPLSDSLNSDPDARFFHDPPELIQIAFGGRPWFLEMGNTNAHRVGLFKGLGWRISDLITRQDERGINMVRITARAKRPSHTEQLFDMEFLRQTSLPDGSYASDPNPPAKIVTHRLGIVAANLKATYAEVLGEHAI